MKDNERGSSQNSNKFNVDDFRKSLGVYWTFTKLSYWQFVNAYEEHKSQIEQKRNEFFSSATPSKPAFGTITASSITSKSIKIANVEIGRATFINKCIADFFHYGRACTDIILQ